MPAKRYVPTAPPEIRRLSTPGGEVTYTLQRKRVRNLNLRISPQGEVRVSAPARMPLREIDAFLAQKAGWIAKHRAYALGRAPEAPCAISKEACLAHFERLSDEVFPLFSDVLGNRPPRIRVREMTTRWGSCNPRTATLTFNTRLVEKPAAAQEYVVLHEYVHFLHPNHGAGFHTEMARLMPDYKQRRKLLK